MDASTPGARGIKNGSKAKLLIFFQTRNCVGSTEMKQDLYTNNLKKCQEVFSFSPFFTIFFVRIYMPKAEPQKFKIQHPMTFNDVRYGLP